MFKAVAACLVLVTGLSAAAVAGEWRAAWYDQQPWAGTGVGFYYSQHPDHIPAWPKRLSGYAVPIFDTMKPMVRVPRYRVAFTTHAEWCAARYLSYEVRSDTYQPYHGPRRYCHSPWR
jgi:hypothetical protein